MNKKKFIIYLLTFAFFPLLLLSANVDIQIEGNKRINDETIVVYGDIKSQNNYSKNEINAILKKLFILLFSLFFINFYHETILPIFSPPKIW